MVELARCQLIVALYPVTSWWLQYVTRLRLESLSTSFSAVRFIDVQQLADMTGPARAVVFTCPREGITNSLSAVSPDLVRCQNGFNGGFIAGSPRIGPPGVEEIVICHGFFPANPLSEADVFARLNLALLSPERDVPLEDRGACASSSGGLPALLISPSQVL